MAPFGLRFFAPVMKSKKDWEGLCIHKFAIFVETVGCCDHPGAPDLCENENQEVNCETYQGATARCADVILAIVLVSDQSDYPGKGILL